MTGDFTARVRTSNRDIVSSMQQAIDNSRPLLLVTVNWADEQQALEAVATLNKAHYETTVNTFTIESEATPGNFLAQKHFDQQMRAAAAVVIATPNLVATDLRGAVGEVATRCRQAGVPTHIITHTNQLDDFALRILDIQQVVQV